MSKATIEQTGIESLVRKAVEDFKSALYRVPNFSERVNKDTRMKLSEAHSIILNIPALIDALSSAESEPTHSDVSQDGGNDDANSFNVWQNADADGGEKYCTMNCGLAVGDKRSRQEHMRDCEDCFVPTTITASQPEAPALTDAQIDIALDRVLRASGSALKHYSVQKTIDGMRNAMRIAISSVQAAVEPIPIEYVTDPDGELSLDWTHGDITISISIGGSGKLSWVTDVGGAVTSGSREFNTTGAQASPDAQAMTEHKDKS